MSAKTWLPTWLQKIYSGSTELAARSGLSFGSGFTLTDDPTHDRIQVTGAPSVVPIPEVSEAGYVPVAGTDGTATWTDYSPIKTTTDNTDPYSMATPVGVWMLNESNPSGGALSIVNQLAPTDASQALAVVSTVAVDSRQIENVIDTAPGPFRGTRGWRGSVYNFWVGQNEGLSAEPRGANAVTPYVGSSKDFSFDCFISQFVSYQSGGTYRRLLFARSATNSQNVRNLTDADFSVYLTDSDGIEGWIPCVHLKHASTDRRTWLLSELAVAFRWLNSGWNHLAVEIYVDPYGNSGSYGTARTRCRMFANGILVYDSTFWSPGSDIASTPSAINATFPWVLGGLGKAVHGLNDFQSRPEGIWRARLWAGARSTIQNTFTADAGTDVLTYASGRDIPNHKSVKLVTTNTLPGGLSTSLIYWTIRQSTTSCKLATTYANAVAGIAIDVTNAGTGTHVIVADDQNVWARELANTTGLP